LAAGIFGGDRITIRGMKKTVAYQALGWKYDPVKGLEMSIEQPG
jgi:hypothetical protein